MRTLASAPPALAHPPAQPWLDRRWLMAAYGVFLAYAVLSAIFAGDRDQVWAIWAACGYAAALLLLWRWGARTAAVLVALAVAVVAPLLVLSVAYPLEAGMVVIDRSATLLIHHGSPYLPSAQVTSWLSYNPYLPVMTLFGLPGAAGLAGLAGNSGVWLALGTVAILGVTFRLAMPHQHCASCRRDALLATSIAVASPVLALNLAVITTDPPVLALMLLALVLAAGSARAAHPARAAIVRAAGSGAVLGVACDLKSTAWLAVPVMAAMFASRDGVRTAGRFIGAAVLTAVVLIAALAPATLFRREAAVAMVQNSVLFPLGLTHDRTPAESLLPGHLLTELGTAGHVVSVGLLIAAGLAVAISLVIRPPRDLSAACWRLAIGLALMFLLGPDVRFGYFIYPLGLFGWLALNPKDPQASGAAAAENQLADARADARLWKAGRAAAERE